MKAGGFRLAKSISNNKNVMNETKKAKSLQVASLNSDIKERTHCIKWDVVKNFTFESITFEREEVTKRTI